MKYAVPAVALVVLAAAAFKLRSAQDEAALRRVRSGMTRDEVIHVVGPPPVRGWVSELHDLELPGNQACRTGASEVYIYLRRWRDSLYVYLNPDGRVLCVERKFVTREK